MLLEVLHWWCCIFRKQCHTQGDAGFPSLCYMLKHNEINHWGRGSGMDYKLLTNSFRKVCHWPCAVSVVDTPLFHLISDLLLVTLFGWQYVKLTLQTFSCVWDCLSLLALLSSEILAKTEETYHEDSPSMWHSPRFIHTANTFGEKLHLLLMYEGCFFFNLRWAIKKRQIDIT